MHQKSVLKSQEIIQVHGAEQRLVAHDSVHSDSVDLVHQSGTELRLTPA